MTNFNSKLLVCQAGYMKVRLSLQNGFPGYDEAKATYCPDAAAGRRRAETEPWFACR